jgi:ribosomal protein S27E
MEDADLRLDGNAVAGLLSELFVYEMTATRSTCDNCGAVGEVGALLVYVHAPGSVVRCPRCGAVLVRVVRTDDRTWLDMRGVRSLEFRTETG